MNAYSLCDCGIHTSGCSALLFVVCVENLVWLMELRVWFLEEEASAWRWAQENKDTLGMRTREAEALATSRSLRIVKRGPFRKGPLTLEWLAVLVEISVVIGEWSLAKTNNNLGKTATKEDIPFYCYPRSLYTRGETQRLGRQQTYYQKTLLLTTTKPLLPN